MLYFGILNKGKRESEVFLKFTVRGKTLLYDVFGSKYQAMRL